MASPADRVTPPSGTRLMDNEKGVGTRLAEAERKAEVAQTLAIVALVIAARPPRRKSIGERLWDLI